MAKLVGCRRRVELEGVVGEGRLRTGVCVVGVLLRFHHVFDVAVAAAVPALGVVDGTCVGAVEVVDDHEWVAAIEIEELLLSADIRVGGAGAVVDVLQLGVC